MTLLGREVGEDIMQDVLKIFEKYFKYIPQNIFLKIYILADRKAVLTLLGRVAGRGYCARCLKNI